MMNLLDLYVGSLKNALQGDLTEAQALYEQAEELKSEQGLSFQSSSTLAFLTKQSRKMRDSGP